MTGLEAFFFSTGPQASPIRSSDSRYFDLRSKTAAAESDLFLTGQAEQKERGRFGSKYHRVIPSGAEVYVQQIQAGTRPTVDALCLQ